MTDYREIANEFAGPGHEQLVEAIATYHHGNESMHMHQNVESRTPCAYCWLRAGRAVRVLAARGAVATGPLAEVAAERRAQDAKWGEQNHPDGTGAAYPSAQNMADTVRRLCQQAASEGTATWRHILTEETYEALAEDDPTQLRAELLQVAAVAVAWIEALDRRAAEEAADRG